MKTLIYSLILVFAFCNCTQNNTSSNDSVSVVYIGIDKTRSTEYSSPPSAEDILSSTYIDKSGSIEVLLSEINDVSLTPVSRFFLNHNKFLSNPMTRQDSIDNFYSSLDKKLQEIFALPNGKTRSSIYLLLCKIVKDISSSGETKKSIIFFTDFMENSSLTTSFYSLYNQSPNFIKSYDSIVEKLEFADSLGDMSDIDVTVVYEPDLSTDGLFLQTRKFWAKYLSSKGANVRFVANL